MATWSYDKDERCGRLKVEGGMTIAQVGQLRESVLQGFAEAERVTLDLTGVHEVDVAGLQLLCSTHRSAVATGKSVSIEGCGKRLRELVRAVGFDRGTLCTKGKESACFWAGMA